MDAQDYIDRIAEKRGSVLEFHKVMANHDFPVLQATDEMVRATVLSDRELDAPTKELLFILCLVAVRGDRDDLATHIRLGLGRGLSRRAILEALEILIPLAGVARFKEGFAVWREVTDAEGIEPTTAHGDRNT